MRDKLKKILENSYAPYSEFRVASILECKDGTLFYGVNVENASYSATICAERNAIFSAISSGYKKGDFKNIYLMNSKDSFAYPCFMCRQVMTEFFTGEEKIVLLTSNNKEEILASEFLKYSFDKSDLF